jgi:hypothetical protein
MSFKKFTKYPRKIKQNSVIDLFDKQKIEYNILLHNFDNSYVQLLFSAFAFAELRTGGV